MTKVNSTSLKSYQQPDDKETKKNLDQNRGTKII